MKKKYISVMFIILFTLSVFYFVRIYTNDDNAMYEDIEITDTCTNSPSPLPEKNYTIDDLIRVFSSDSDFTKYEIIKCALKNDDKIPELKGFILYYDKETNNSCNVAFIGDNVILNKICFAVNSIKGLKTFKIANEQSFIYTGEGTVKTRIYKVENNEIYDYTINFSMDQSKASSTITVKSEKLEDK